MTKEITEQVVLINYNPGVKGLWKRFAAVGPIKPLVQDSTADVVSFTTIGGKTIEELETRVFMDHKVDPNDLSKNRRLDESPVGKVYHSVRRNEIILN